VKRAPIRRGRRAQIFLTLLCLALLGAIYGALERPSIDEFTTAAPLGAAAAKQTAAAPPSRFTLPPLNELGHVLERPIFSSTRRPPERVPGAPAQSASFVLVGIVISSSGRQALIELGEPSRLHRIGEGQVLAGWTVESILPDRVVVSQGAVREEVKPKDKAPKLMRAPGASPSGGAQPRPKEAAGSPQDAASSNPALPPELAEMLGLRPKTDAPPAVPPYAPKRATPAR
jgi:hypothetical protein